MTELTEDATREEIEVMNERLLLIIRLIRHDVRNDMATAKGWAEELGDHVDDDGEEPLHKVLDAIERTMDMTRVSRDFVKAAMTGPNANVEPVPLRPAIEREVERLREVDDSAHVKVEAVPDIEVCADDLLSSVLANVLENACKHNDRPEPHVVVSAERDDDTVTVRIADDGPGMPAEKHEAVFGRGEQGLEDPAAGLGLHLVDGLVTGYGGSVRMEGNEPEGAVAVIELRVAQDGDGADGDDDGDAAGVDAPIPGGEVDDE